MSTDLKRFTVSVTSNMEACLKEAKKEIYYMDTQSDMIRDLIIRGLASIKQEQTEQLSQSPETISMM